MKYNCIEKTIEVRHGYTIVRLWIDITKQDLLMKEEDIIKNVRDCVGRLKDHKNIINYLSKTTPNVNAIQVYEDDELQNTKVGMVAYTVPFTDDVHG